MTATGHRSVEDRLVVYHLNIKRDFLAPCLFPGAEAHAITLETTADELINSWPAGRDLALFQINFSNTATIPHGRPHLISTLLGRGIRVLNAGLTDIRKSALHELLKNLGLPDAAAPRTGDPDEWLMVKTDCNYGAVYERALDTHQRRRLGAAEGESPIKDWSEYRRLQRREIDAAWWLDPTLIIERYIENPDGRFYRAYRVGEHVIIVEAYSQKVIKKVTDNSKNVNYTASLGRLRQIDADGALPLALVRVVEKALTGCGLDFGSIDIMDDGAGSFFVVDLNDTPYGGPMAGRSEAVEHLRTGLDAPIAP